MQESNAKPMYCGCISGPETRNGFETFWGASEVIPAQGGKFVFLNASTKYAEIAEANEVVDGWVDDYAHTASSTGGTEPIHVINDLNARFVIPLAYDGSTYTVNYSHALIGETCDIVVVSSVQYANPTASTYDQIVIYGGKAASSTTANDGYLIVGLSPNRSLTGAA